MSEDFKNILDEVKGLKKKIKFYSPTKDKDYELEPLTLKQQKDILEKTMSSNLSVLFFNNILYNIIKENTSIDLTELDTIDRVSIALSFRERINNEYEINGKEVLISDIIEKNRQKHTTKPKTITVDNYKFYLKPPNIIKDNDINKILINKYKNKDEEKYMNSLISDLYVYELSKFIVKMDINDHEFDFENNINDGISILKEIDSSVFKKVFEYISEIRDIEFKLTEIPDTKDSISLTPDFFIVQ